MKKSRLITASLVALSLILAGCGSNQASQSSSNEASSSKSSQSKAVSSSISKETSSRSSSASSTTSSSSNASSASSSKTSTKDTQATTTSMSLSDMYNWAYSQVSRQYARQDISMTSYKADNGATIIQIVENHNSPNMKAKGVDPNTAPTIAWFEVTTKGALYRSDDGGANFYLVANHQ